MNNMTWILVADASKAKIYSAHKAKLFTGGNLTLISEHTHDDSRKKDSEIASDKQGKFGSGTFVETTDPKQHEEERFAVELAKLLDKAKNENHFHELIFIAPAAFMGKLNKHISSELSKMVNLTIEKDYTHCTDREVAEHLQSYL